MYDGQLVVFKHDSSRNGDHFQRKREERIPLRGKKIRSPNSSIQRTFYNFGFFFFAFANFHRNGLRVSVFPVSQHVPVATLRFPDPGRRGKKKKETASVFASQDSWKQAANIHGDGGGGGGVIPTSARHPRVCILEDCVVHAYSGEMLRHY